MLNHSTCEFNLNHVINQARKYLNKKNWDANSKKKKIQRQKKSSIYKMTSKNCFLLTLRNSRIFKFYSIECKKIYFNRGTHYIRTMNGHHIPILEVKKNETPTAFQKLSEIFLFRGFSFWENNICWWLYFSNRFIFWFAFWREVIAFAYYFEKNSCSCPKSQKCWKISIFFMIFFP